MKQNIKMVTLPLPYRLGNVNCFLINTNSGFILVDTGGPNNRNEIMEILDEADCKPENLNLIVLTHGDYDHAGNAAYLRDNFGVRIAMHYYDAGMVETGDMFFNRGKMNIVVRKLLPMLFGFKKDAWFKPDLFLREGTSLAEYGWDAQVIHIPGHSKGSIGILTQDGDLICGDLFENIKSPTFNSLSPDIPTSKTSARKLASHNINIVYPGHGAPFTMDALIVEM